MRNKVENIRQIFWREGLGERILNGEVLEKLIGRT